MFAATDTAWAPWYIAHTDDKKRGRLNIISHLLSQVPYKPLTPRDVTLPKRQQADGYTEPDLPLQHIPTPFQAANRGSGTWMTGRQAKGSALDWAAWRRRALWAGCHCWRSRTYFPRAVLRRTASGACRACHRGKTP